MNSAVFEPKPNHPSDVIESIDEFKPTGYKVLVRLDKRKKVTDGGLVLPGDGEQVRTGTVLAVGPGRVSKTTGKHIPMQIKVGDRVMLGAKGGWPVFLRNGDDVERLILVRETGEEKVDEILAILD